MSSMVLEERALPPVAGDLLVSSRLLIELYLRCLCAEYVMLLARICAGVGLSIPMIWCLSSLTTRCLLTSGYLAVVLFSGNLKPLCAADVFAEEEAI